MNQIAEKRLKLLAKTLRPKGIDVRAESYGWSVIQTLLSRGDRRLAPVIMEVRGSQNSLGGWKKAYRKIEKENNLDKNNPQSDLPKLAEWEEVIHKNWITSKVLPWSHLQGPIPQEILIKHQTESLGNLTL